MTKYLYGASVQGIQQFIFQTNELKDIVGASELVESICTELFRKVVGERWKEANQVISAAGNVKYIFEDRAECEEVVRNFPREVMTNAPGVTISQAVVELGNDFVKSVNELEGKLRSQRNKPCKSITVGRLGLNRSPQTGLPITELDEKKEKEYDASTYAKRKHNKVIKLCQKSFGEKVDLKSSSIPFDVEKMTGKNDWIAIIHADGNGLGQIVQKIGHNIEDFRQFSKELNNATIAAANDAFRKVSPEHGWEQTIPIRPIVLGGDDMTVIIRGELAIEYVIEFMKKFEQYSSEGNLRPILEKAGMKRLTACAGVAFIKSSYPFYYGYALAEQLCKYAKKTEPHTSTSSLMFHKVQDSFINNYEDIVQRELKTSEGSSFCFGPYYLNEGEQPNGYYTIEKLYSLCQKLGEDKNEGIKTGIRQWLTLMHEDEAKAIQRLKRLKTLNEDKDAVSIIEALTNSRKGNEKVQAYPAYDVLTYHTILNQQTKEK